MKRTMKNNNYGTPRMIFTFVVAFAFSLFTNIYSQDASFSVSSTETCTGTELTFTITNYNATYTYNWDYGNDITKSGSEATHKYTYYNAGIYYAALTAIDGTNGNTVTKKIEVDYTPIADISTNSLNHCVGERIALNNVLTPFDSIIWNLGDGTTIITKEAPAEITYNYATNNLYKVKTDVMYGRCKSSDSLDITISGPIASFDISADSACKGEEVIFTYNEGATDVASYSWNLGEEGAPNTGSSVKHAYSITNNVLPQLQVIGTGGEECIIEKPLYIYNVVADFAYNEELLCNNYAVAFQNNSNGNDNNLWDFDNGTISDLLQPPQKFNTGNYTVKLNISNKKGCMDSTSKTLTINDVPSISISEDKSICAGSSVELDATGGHQIEWSPASGLSTSNEYDVTATPASTQTYTAVVTDTNTHCRSSDNVLVFVQQNTIDSTITLPYTDTSIFIGEKISISVDSGDYTYSWSPASDISCDNCTNPVFQPMEDTEYTLYISDKNDCFTNEYYLSVIVKKEYNVVLPTAFTPEGEEADRIVYVKGWGIKELVYFKVYNRHGNEVFTSNSIELGWDGTFKEKLQPADNYVWMVKAIMWDDSIVESTGTILLLR